MYEKSSKVRDLTGIVMILTLIQCSCMASCPTEEDGIVPKVDQIVGKWFGVSGVSPNPNSPGKCFRIEITNASSESFSMQFTSKNGSPLRDITINDDVTISDMKGVSKLVGSPRSFGPNQRRFLAIGSNYAVLFFCAFSQHGRSFPDHAIVMSKTKEIDPTILTNATAVLARFVPENRIIAIEQEECTQ